MVTATSERDTSFDVKVADKVHQHSRRRGRHIDRLFAGLMLLQWIACIVAVLLISPSTWIGETSTFTSICGSPSSAGLHCQPCRAGGLASTRARSAREW